MKKKNEEGEYLSQQEIDAIIDEIIENEPIPAVKEHLIKYEKEYRRKRDQQKLEKHQLNEENETYDKKLPDINLPSIGSYILVDINSYSDDDLIKAKGALPKMLMMERSTKNTNKVKEIMNKMKKVKLTKEETELLSVYITNVVREKDNRLADELLEEINKEREEENMGNFGQVLVDYIHESVAKGERKRRKKTVKRKNK
ncbi:MAG: hypothetical protein Q4C11_00300 [Clostridium sp.]|nr:hypothetical protein [Clostridium sp.]